MKFDRSNKFDLCYYVQVNSLRLKSSVASKWASKHLWGTIYFAGDDTFRLLTSNYLKFLLLRGSNTLGYFFLLLLNLEAWNLACVCKIEIS